MFQEGMFATIIFHKCPLSPAPQTSLSVHPDRVAEAERAACTAKFQAVGAVYALLTDPAKRGLYDESGEVDEEGDLLPDKDWAEYWRNLFPVVTPGKIDEFKEEYRGSAEERADIKAAYTEARGEMGQVLDTVLCAGEEDEERFREIIGQMIKDEEVEKFEAFGKVDKEDRERRKKASEAEAAEAEEAAEEMGLGGGEEGLRAGILARQNNRAQQADSFLENLAAKYASKPKKETTKRKRPVEADTPEAEEAAVEIGLGGDEEAAEEVGLDDGEEGERVMAQPKKDDSFLNNLEAMYAPKPKKSKAKK